MSNDQTTNLLYLGRRTRLNDRNPRKLFAICAITVILLGVLSVARIPTVSATTTPFSRHMVFIIMENHPLSSITSSSTPYMNETLAPTYTRSTNYVGPPSTASCPSLPNYLNIFSGQDWGTGSTSSCNGYDGGPHSNPATNAAWNCASPCNLVDLLTANSISWKAYMEGLSPNNICNGSGSSDGGNGYIVHHDPFAYFSNIANDTVKCQQVVPAGTYTGGTSACNGGTPSNVASTLISDLGNPSTAPSFMWVTPNNYDNMHECSSSSQMIQGDNWLSVLIPSILQTATFTGDGTATVIVTFDEPSSGTYGIKPVYFVVAGPGAPLAHSSRTHYTHLNLLKTWESNGGLGCLVTGNDCSNTVVPMTEFFIPSFAMSTSPSSISIFCNVFGCDPARTVNSSLTITGVNQFQGPVTLSYIAPSNSIPGVYVRGPPSSGTVPLGGSVIVVINATGSGTTSGTFIWTVKGSVQGVQQFSFNTTLSVTYTWCAHCVLPP